MFVSDSELEKAKEIVTKYRYRTVLIGKQILKYLIMWKTGNVDNKKFHFKTKFIGKMGPLMD